MPIIMKIPLKFRSNQGSFYEKSIYIIAENIIMMPNLCKVTYHHGTILPNQGDAINRKDTHPKGTHSRQETYSRQMLVMKMAKNR